MLRKMISKLLGLGHTLGHTLDQDNWLFPLPEDASQAVVLYHDCKMQHRAEPIAADKVYNEAREKMHADCKAIGKSNSYNLDDDHPIKIEWDKSSQERDVVRKQHNLRSKAAHAVMTEDESTSYNKLWADWCYSDANAKDPVEHVSPSGNFKLVITQHETSPGCWGYTKGRVYHHNGDNPIAEVRRNYSSFPFAWMEEHVDDYDYLICGEDYQGQTFVQLNTGKVVNNKSVGSDKGHGFCWASYRLLGDGKTLLVGGCYWACPYELKFFDVSDPMNGWPERELPAALDYLDPDKSELKVEGGLILWEEMDYVYKPTGEREGEIDFKGSDLHHEVSKAEHQNASEEVVAAAKARLDAHYEFYPDDHEEEVEKWERVANRRIQLKVVDGEFAVVEDWKSDWQLERDRKYEESRKKSLERSAKWLAEDTFYQHLVDTVERDAFTLSYSHQSLVSRWKGDANEVYFRATLQQGDINADHSSTLIWGHNDGKIKTELWVRGKGNIKSPEFPRSLAGMTAAWATAQKHMGVS